ncbi:MAG: beta-lactamase family protein [Limnochordia bacterium]|nr:beta-lactamase family protein [Limnochordia bacterium]
MSQFDSAKLEAFVLAEMEKQRIPGLSLSFVGPHGTLFEKAYGYCHEGTKQPVTVDTIMGVASLSKSFTGVALAILEEEGKLRFTDPVTRFFPQFKIPGTPKDAVLIKHLLCHTTGLPLLPTLDHCMDAHTKRDPGEKRDTDALTELLKVQTAQDIVDYICAGDYEPLGQPGEYMNYSNDCYAILSSIVDMAAGMSMEDFLDQRIFKPLGMGRSALGFERLGDYDNVTQLFSKDDDGKITASDNWQFAPPYRGCGWIISSSSDMARYYRMLASGGVHEGKRFLGMGAERRILGDEFPTTETGVYTYGLAKALWRGHTLFTHTGGLKGISSAGGFLKDTGYAGVVLTNIGGANPMRILMGAFNILEGLEPDTPAHSYRPVDREPQEPRIYEGFYSSREGGLSRCAHVHKVEYLNGELSIALSWEDTKRKLHFCGENYFLAAKEGEDPVNDGTVISLFVSQDKAWALKMGSRMYQRI